MGVPGNKALVMIEKHIKILKVNLNTQLKNTG
jgi:hypothetical protein